MFSFVVRVLLRVFVVCYVVCVVWGMCGVSMQVHEGAPDGGVGGVSVYAGACRCS